MSFKIGDKVVCIDDRRQLYGGLVLGEIYTVIGLHSDEDAIYVKEIPLYAHWNNRFRKLDYTFATETLECISQEIEEEMLEKEWMELEHVNN